MRYWRHLLVVQGEHVAYTRMVKDASTAEAARKVARWMLQQGR